MSWRGFWRRGDELILGFGTGTVFLYPFVPCLADLDGLLLLFDEPFSLFSAQRHSLVKNTSLANSWARIII